MLPSSEAILNPLTTTPISSSLPSHPTRHRSQRKPDLSNIKCQKLGKEKLGNESQADPVKNLTSLYPKSPHVFFEKKRASSIFVVDETEEIASDTFQKPDEPDSAFETSKKLSGTVIKRKKRTYPFPTPETNSLKKSCPDHEKIIVKIEEDCEEIENPLKQLNSSIRDLTSLYPKSPHVFFEKKRASSIFVLDETEEIASDNFQKPDEPDSAFETSQKLSGTVIKRKKRTYPFPTPETNSLKKSCPDHEKIIVKIEEDCEEIENPLKQLNSSIRELFTLHLNGTTDCSPDNSAIGLRSCTTTAIWPIFPVEESAVKDKVHDLKPIADNSNEILTTQKLSREIYTPSPPIKWFKPLPPNSSFYEALDFDSEKFKNQSGIEWNAPEESSFIDLLELNPEVDNYFLNMFNFK